MIYKKKKRGRGGASGAKGPKFYGGIGEFAK